MPSARSFLCCDLARFGCFDEFCQPGRFRIQLPRVAKCPKSLDELLTPDVRARCFAQRDDLLLARQLLARQPFGLAPPLLLVLPPEPLERAGEIFERARGERMRRMKLLQRGHRRLVTARRKLDARRFDDLGSQSVVLLVSQPLASSSKADGVSPSFSACASTRSA